MRSKHKIILFLIASFSVLLILFGVGIYYFQYNYSYTDFYKRLKARVSIAWTSSYGGDASEASSLREFKAEHLEELSEEREYILPIEGPDAASSISAGHGLPLGFVEEVIESGMGRRKVNDSFYYGERREHEGKPFLVVVSAKNYYGTHHLIWLRNILVVGFLASVLIVIYLSFFFSRNLFAPINNIIGEVNQISSNNIHLRLNENVDDRDIKELVKTFNNLLNRIETTFETHKNFISNASHEFGTPLTSIIGEADVALSRERNPEYYKESMQKILHQAERLNKVSQALLLLAQTGYKENRLTLDRIRTDELILQSKEIMNQLMPENSIQLDFSLLPENPTRLKVLGNKELLLLSFTNILTNACKYSHNKPVFVSLACTDTEVVVVVKDQGIGIPEDELPFIYDPFFRASNTQLFEGYGIGLPLTRNIVHIHKGTLLVTSPKGGGTSVQIRIPIA